MYCRMRNSVVWHGVAALIKSVLVLSEREGQIRSRKEDVRTFSQSAPFHFITKSLVTYAQQVVTHLMITITYP